MLALAAPAVLAGGCRRAEPPPNIVLITVDALRPDHLSCYGYGRKTSPAIDALAARGTLFRNACAASCWTPPSLASLMTSLPPRTHGVVHGQVSPGEKKVLHQQFLSARFRTLAETLKSAGYATFGVSTTGHTAAETGFGRGFDRYAGLWFADAAEADRSVEGFLGDMRKSPPYFLWIHYFDPHDPYFAREPWITEYNPGWKRYAAWSQMVMRDMQKRKGEIAADPALLGALKDFYDSEINYADAFIGKLLEKLPDGGRAMVILSADHGEEFMDHGLIGHGNSLFEELIRVPLIAVLPGAGKSIGTVDVPVSALDILPTICDAAGIRPPAGVEGRSLLPLMRGERPGGDRAVYAELDRPRTSGHREAMRLGKWKYILSGWDGPEEFLFDLSRDPGERHDLFPREREVAAGAREAMRRWIGAHPEYKAPAAASPLSGERKKALRSLNYLN